VVLDMLVPGGNARTIATRSSNWESSSPSSVLGMDVPHDRVLGATIDRPSYEAPLKSCGSWIPMSVVWTGQAP
jgi:hypothetical protein